MNDETAPQGRLIGSIRCHRIRRVGAACPTCGQEIERELAEVLEHFAREVAAVDRAVRVRKLAAVRDESPFVPPPSVLAELGRAA